AKEKTTIMPRKSDCNSFLTASSERPPATPPCWSEEASGRGAERHEEAIGGQSVCPSWSLSSSGLPCPIRRRLSDPAHKNQSSVVQALVRIFFPRLDVKGIVVTGAQFLIK